PIIHFYETFLSEYDPKLRKARGVWYTPHPVVSFIVRAVDDILKTEFNLPMGLADSSKIKIKVDEHGKKIEQEVHKVQILDPATGTGTFLAEVIKHIYDNNFKSMQGIWSDYAENNLLPRLNGFELLMASYAMAHLKLDLLLKETGYAPKTDRRLKIYLTNSLEEYHKDTGTLFASWLSSEANEANRIKRDAPVMVIMGNPPYSGISSNNGEWISNLIEDYKYIDGEHFKERKHWLNDDYVKFIRYGQHFVEKNGSGILAFINNHSFIDNPTFRGMRWNLLKTFDKIYILDLHGNAKKKETCHDGSKDENVFDIQQGVSINLFVKTGKKKKDELGQVFHYDLIEKRQKKYEFLNTNSIKSTPFEKLQPKKPNLFFIPKNEDEWPAYKNGISIDELFKKQSMGITTARDHFVIEIDKNILLSKMYDFFDQKQTDQEIRTKYFGNKTSSKYLIGDTRGWKLAEARKNTDNLNIDNQIKEIAYRPFDNRHIFYNKKMVDWGREDIMDHLLFNNYAFICVRIGRDENAHNFLISNQITDKSITSSLDNSNVFPLYLYSDNNSDRTPNLNSEIVQKIADELDLKFTNEKEADSGTFAPIDILDYIYAVLHSPTYREKYKEFLKIDFPRVPYPKDKETFFKLVQLGGELRQIHLLESPTVGKYITQYPVGGENVVNKPKFVNGKVYINDTQYFDGVPEVAWNFYIGGYQPAQKWLKDRKGRKLEFDDILHYQKIIVALTETDRIMQVIDGVEVE
ncbi:MAG: N-6 DNA methylase, partial [Candidatus Delongbacteria bacterium]|nr:N-6 DNA methylase [Candidatus Delongbacteria bacterium]